MTMMESDANEPSHCIYCGLPIPRPLFKGRTPASEPPQYCCYGCQFAAQVTKARGESGHAAWMVTRLGLSVFLSMGVMVFSLAMYGQDIYRVDPAASPVGAQWTGLVRYVLLLLSTPVFLLLGLPILGNAWQQLRAGIGSTDALVVLGVAGAYVSSYVATLRESGPVYYETACMILVLVTVGRYLEATGKLKASTAVQALHALVPDEVTVRRGGEDLTLRPDDVHVGDVVRVPAGQHIAVDGTIESGQANVDEQLLTGESTPVVKSAGDTVHAGTVNLDGTLDVRATGVGTHSAVGRMAALLEEAKIAKGFFERLADRVASVFVPLTVALACVGGYLGYQRGGGNEAIMTALAVLLISCPCALGIATPMAIWVALGRAASMGVLFRNGEAVEALSKVRAIAFDKTGTLTTGTPAVECITTPPGDDESRRSVLALAAGLANASTHMLARGITAHARHEGIEPAPVSDVRTLAGRGLIGKPDDGTVRLGNPAMMQEASISMVSPLKEAVARAEQAGQPLSCVARDDKVVGVITFAESLRAEAHATLAELAGSGHEVKILTGDHAGRGAAVAEQLGVETLASLTPQQKIETLQQWRRDRGGAVAMVGDGLNDAPALAAADVGIALGCGADLTRESAAVCLLGNDLAVLPETLALARRTVRTIKVNLFWAFAYNVVGMGLAVAGKLNPIIAAGAMVLSSLFVVTNSLRLGRTEEAADHAPPAEGYPSSEAIASSR